MATENVTFCLETADCQLISPGVPKHCYEQTDFSEEENFCDCLNWQGWVGEDCSQESPQLYYYRASILLTILWSFLVMLYTLRTMIYHLKYWIFPRRSMHPIFVTGSLVFIGVFFMFLSAMIQLPALFDHTRFTYGRFSDLNEYYLAVLVTGGKFAGDCNYIATSFYVIVTIQILNSWNEIVKSTTKFYANMFCISAMRMKKIISISLTLNVLILLFLALIDVLFLVMAYLFLTGIAITLVYILSYSRVMKALNLMKANESESLQRSIYLVRISATVNTAALTSFCLFGFASLFFVNTYTSKFKPGDINYAVVTRDCLIWCGLILMSFNSWFFLEITRNLIGRDSKLFSKSKPKERSKREEKTPTPEAGSSSNGPVQVISQKNDSVMTLDL